MDIVKSITDDIQKRLAARQAEVMREVLGARIPSMTFRELKAVLTSPLATPLLDHTIGDLLATKTAEPEPEPEPERSKKQSATRRSKKSTKATTAKGPRGKRSSAKVAAKPAKAKSAKAKSAKTKSAKTKSTKRMTPTQRKAYETRILTVLRDAGDWVDSGELRRKVGGKRSQHYYSMRLLCEAGLVERTGERNRTKFRTAARRDSE